MSIRKKRFIVAVIVALLCGVGNIALLVTAIYQCHDYALGDSQSLFCSITGSNNLLIILPQWFILFCLPPIVGGLYWLFGWPRSYDSTPTEAKQK